MASQDQEPVSKPSLPQALALEAWSEALMVGALITMSLVTIANMRRGVWLHKIILLELVLGYWQGFSILFPAPIYTWWLSVTGIFLNMSWSLHNIVAWMKLRPFLTRKASTIFLGSVLLVQPYWAVEMYATIAYYNSLNNLFLKTRPLEALFRDPWWIFAAMFLPYTIKTKYDLSVREVLHTSPRFVIMMCAMGLSVVFIVLDVLSVTQVLKSVLPVGINPFWKLSFVLKCLTDTVILDDFKTALDRITAFKHGHSQVLEYLTRDGSRHVPHVSSAQDATLRNFGHGATLRNNSTWDEMHTGRLSRQLPQIPVSKPGDIHENSSYSKHMSRTTFSNKVDKSNVQHNMV